jgi:hypothetical protein
VLAATIARKRDPGRRLWINIRSLGDPFITDFHIRPLDCGPGDAVRGFLPARIARMRFESVIECLAIDVLCMRRQVPTHRRRKIGVRSIGHDCLVRHLYRIRFALLWAVQASGRRSRSWAARCPPSQCSISSPCESARLICSQGFAGAERWRARNDCEHRRARLPRSAVARPSS